jgi:hypothetical protein
MSNWDNVDSDGMITSVFQPGAVAVHAKMYQAWVTPELHPDEPQPRLENWPLEDKIAYCGGEYARESYSG